MRKPPTVASVSNLYLLLSEGIHFFLIIIESLLKSRHFLLGLILCMFSAVQDTTLAQLKHSPDMLWPVEHCAVQLDVFICQG